MAAAASALSRLPGGIALLAVTVGVRRQLVREWTGSPPHRWLLARPKPEGLGVQPRDLRPPDPENGRRILAGAFTFAGASLQLDPGGDPWDRPSPSLRFALALHRFGWMRDLLALGEEGAAEGLRLTLEWRRLFGRWNAFSWRPEVVERRAFNLACAARTLCERASDAETALIALDLARQGRHLLFSMEGPVRAAERACAAALAGASLTGAAADALMGKALARLERALPRTVEPDGGHASRSPQASLELMFDLVTLDEVLAHRGLAAPDEMVRAIDRLAGALRFFTLADGGLPAFQGGDESRRDYVAAARVRDDDGEDRPTPASRNGYHRLEGKSLQVIADAAPPAEGPWSVTACAQPLAIEVLAGARRLVVNSGWSPDAQGPPALRVVDAASTATIGDQPCGAPLRGLAAAALGPRIAHGYDAVEARRHEAEGARWLELSHDGWGPRFGLRHERRLYIDVATDELRGEDCFTPLAEAPAVRGDNDRRFAPFMVRFHIHPDVRVSLARDRKSVLLRAEGGPETGWWLRNDALEVEIEPSIHFEDGRPRRTSQVVLRGQVRLDRGARIRWKLAAAEVWPPPR